MAGTVFDIQRFCVHDGPGIRTTVFLKGCNIRCKWCHNPESYSTEPQLMFYPDKCVLCGRCAAVCPNGVHRITEDGKHVLDRSSCAACGKCAETCLLDALEISGKLRDADYVMKVVDKDARYYASSGGGVTFSGGEATVQFEFLKELLMACGERKYHRALETNGIIPEQHLMELLPLVDLYLLDYKITGREEHIRWTGAPNDRLFETLRILGEAEKHVILRCPIIPGVNDKPEHFAAIRELRKKYPNIENAEIMAYHDIGEGKWDALGADYSFKGLESASSDQKKEWEAQIR